MEHLKTKPENIILGRCKKCKSYVNYKFKCKCLPLISDTDCLWLIK